MLRCHYENLCAKCNETQSEPFSSTFTEYIQIVGQLEVLILIGTEDKGLGPDLVNVTQLPQLTDSVLLHFI